MLGEKRMRTDRLVRRVADQQAPACIKAQAGRLTGRARHDLGSSSAVSLGDTKHLAVRRRHHQEA